MRWTMLLLAGCAGVPELELTPVDAPDGIEGAATYYADVEYAADQPDRQAFDLALKRAAPTQPHLRTWPHETTARAPIALPDPLAHSNG